MAMNGDEFGESDGPGARNPGASRATVRMRRAVTAAKRGQACPEELEAAARELVGELRAANEPPEQMLVRIKEILAESGLRPSYATDSAHPVGRDDAVYRDVIMWSIQAYYGEERSR